MRLARWQELVSLSALEAWMDERDLGDGAVANVTMLVGGTQNLLLRFERGERAFVLRRPPARPRSDANETMRREALVLGALAQTDVPHPRLIAACSDSEILGADFYLMEAVEGFNAASPNSPAGDLDDRWRERMGLALVEGIARLAGLDHRAIGLGDFGQPEQYLERQVPRLLASFESYAQTPGWPGPSPLRGIDRVAEWLERHRPSKFTPGLIHGDYHFANVLFRADRPELAAIVDWELATIGDPLMDLGWLLAIWPDESGENLGPVIVSPWRGYPTADELASHYGAMSRRDLSSLDWYVTMACFKLAILLEGTHVRACEGKADRSIGDRLHAGAIWLMERACTRIT